MRKKTITVYVDPTTRTRPEGEAVVLDVELSDNTGLDYARVRFVGDDWDSWRWIEHQEVKGRKGKS